MKLLKSIDQNSHIVKTNYLITLFSFLFVLVFVSICYILDFEFKFSDFTWSLIFIGYIVFVYIFRYINKVNLVEIYSLFYNHPFYQPLSFSFYLIELLKNNIVPLICFLFLLYGIYAYWSFKYDTKQTTELPFQIKKIEGVNYEHLTFLATYVIPLITFDFEKSRYIIVLSMLLIVMCIIYIKTDLFYANPSLALLGFHIYKVDGEFINAEMREGIIIITRRRLNKNDRVRYIKLDERIYYSDN